MDLAFILALNSAGLANCQIQRQLDTAEGLAIEPARIAGRVRGCEADLVITGIGSGECEAASRRALL